VNTRSLTFRLVTWYGSVLAAVFLVLGVLTLVLLRHFLEAGQLDSQMKRARQIADTLVTAQLPASTGLAQEVEALYSPEQNERFIRISTADGRVVYLSGMPVSGRFDPKSVPLPARGHTSGFPRKEVLGSGSLLVAALPYVSASGARYIVEVGVSAASTEATLRQVLWLLAISLPIALAVAVAGGTVLVRRAFNPVERIARKAQAITQHNLSERLPVVRTGDELEQLALSLNHMIGRLEDAVQASKRFVADASHELRTPLAVLRGELEGLAQDRELKAHTREALGSLLEEVDRLSDVVEGLLALSRLDAGEGKSAWVAFDLAELATSTAEQMSLLAEDKSIRVVCQSSPGAMVEGDRARLKQVIVNLLDNAIKYTPPGGRVELKVTREGGCAVLDVVDNGIGIPAEALSHVFQRFFRADGSRSREQGGAGLGLSIVKSICAAHGACVEVLSEPGKGSTFRIRQPLLAQPPTAPRIAAHV
jgi:heavy metal sensor kinase